MYFVWQPNQESLVLAMSRAFDDYYIKDYGVILAPKVTQRRTDSNDHSPSSGSFCVSLSLILFANTHLPFCISKRVWWCVPDD
jgi:hypothetical protein